LKEEELNRMAENADPMCSRMIELLREKVGSYWTI